MLNIDPPLKWARVFFFRQAKNQCVLSACDFQQCEKKLIVYFSSKKYFLFEKLEKLSIRKKESRLKIYTVRHINKELPPYIGLSVKIHQRKKKT